MPYCTGTQPVGSLAVLDPEACHVFNAQSTLYPLVTLHEVRATAIAISKAAKSGGMRAGGLEGRMAWGFGGGFGGWLWVDGWLEGEGGILEQPSKSGALTMRFRKYTFHYVLPPVCQTLPESIFIHRIHHLGESQIESD